MSKRLGGWRGRLWRWSFLRHLRRRLRELQLDDAPKLVQLARREAESLYRQRITPDLDRQGHLIVNLCSLVLATYRVVQAKTGDAVLAFNVAQQVCGITLRKPFQMMLRLFLMVYRDPVGWFARKSFVEGGRKSYGTSMEFGEEHTPDGVDMLVRRCAFHQFFVDHGLPGLTLALCNWDRNWMDLFDASRRPIRTERPTTISTGGDCCRFRFVRDANKQVVPVSDVVLEVLPHATPLAQATWPEIAVPSIPHR